MKLSELKNLVVGEVVEVKGSLMYAKYLTKRLAGAELEEQIKREAKFSEYPNENARFEFQVADPAVVKKEAKPSDAEIYVKSKIYETKDGTKHLRVTRNSNKDTDPGILMGVRQADGKIKKTNLMGKSLENEQPITVQYEVYERTTKAGKKVPSIGIKCVIFEEEPKIWTPSSSSLPDGWESDDDDTTAAPAEATAEAPAEEAPADDVWAD